jgi:hypothetical protein
MVVLPMLLAVAVPLTPTYAENRIDGQRPDAPDLAAYGPHAIGVRTLQMVNRDQVDILKIDPKAAKPDALPRL